jgi:hypothetical protein
MKRLSLLLSALVLASQTTRAALDLNTDGVPDIWATVHGLGALNMSVDSDGDGQTNAQEALWGTNPMSPGDIVKIKSITSDQYGVHLVFAGQLGKKYQVQVVETLGAVWANLGSPVNGTDGDVTATTEVTSAGQKYYRVVVSDADTDGDGVSDWEEVKLGFDPTNNHSNGSSGPDDLAAITAALTSPSVLSVVGVDTVAIEPPAGVPASDTAAFAVSRTGGLLPITIQYNTTGSAATPGTDYAALSGSVQMGLGVKSVIVPVVPLSDAAVESPESVLLNLVANASYTLGAPATAGTIINDRSSAAGNGLRARFFNEASSGANQLNPDGTIPPGTAPLFANQIVTRIDPVVDYNWLSGTTQGTHSPAVGVNVDYFASRWTGEVLPEFSQIYTFSVEQNRCGRLWVNGKLLVNKWPGNGDAADNASGTYTGTIELQAGVRYPIVLEHFDTTGDGEMHLRWQSANQPLQIIPTARLFADTAPQILGDLEVLIIKDSGAYVYQITASGSPTSYAAANLPPGWTINNVTGAISGNPNMAGEWNVPITAANAAGSGSAILNIKVIATGGAITRDVWMGVPGTAVTDIPLTTAPTATGNISALEAPQNAADDFGARIRGYITVPATGIYKFYLTASNTSELYISNDDEPVNSFKRAEVNASTGYREWTHASAGKSPLLQLEAGKRYFVEVRHKAGVGADHVSVGWIKPGEGGVDPGNFVPVAGSDVVVPGFTLSPYVPPAPVSGESTLFVTALTAQGGALTSGFGSSSIELSADETQAILRFNYSNLTTPVTAKHVHSDAFDNHTQGEIIFDIDDFQPQQDGSFVWDLVPVGTFGSTAQLVDALKRGAAYLNVHTSQYPNGEIRGNYRLAAASQTFTPPPPQPWSDPGNASSAESHLNRDGASRFLVQATFGVTGIDANGNANPDDVDSVQSLGFEGWIDDQFNKPISYHYPFVFANRNQVNGQGSTYSGSLTFNSWWRNAVTAPDQLRQRMAFALSEILVTSENGVLDDRADALSDYYDMLLDHSFGNFRDLLIATSLHPAMGRYLDMLGNDKPNLSTGLIPNENYAREILQLFSIGLNRMHPDGSLMLNSKGELIPTYDQDAIIGFAHAFTGWYYNSPTVNPRPTSFSAAANWIQPMTPVPARHFIGRKRLLNNEVLPGIATIAGAPIDPYVSHASAQINDPAYQNHAEQELLATHEAIFNHPNVGPFLCRQLIQRLVTGTPSPGYLYRVASKFNDNGSGVRGDLKAVIRAILLDYEARSATAASSQGFGKQREPISRVAAVARAFPPPAPLAGTYNQVGSLIAVSTPTNHSFASGNSIYLDFEPSTSGDAGEPTDATYAIANLAGTGPFTFNTRTKSFEGPVNYSQGGGIVTLTQSGDGFAFGTNESIYIEYLTGSPLPASGADTVEFRSSDEFRIVFGGPTTKRGTYAQTVAGGTTVTITMTAHGFAAGTTLHFDFVSNSTALPTSGQYTIATVPNANSFTITVPETGAARTGTVFTTPPADLLPAASGTANVCRAADFANRSGNLAVTYSDWNMDSTDTDLNQTPMRSPTVFNYFLPDYQFPGILANAGLITPEFEITSETSVIRQANFLYNGIFNDALGTVGLCSFKGGARDLIMDLRPWMGTGPGGLPWTHNSNLNALIDELSTRLMGGQLPTAAKTIIRNYVQTLPYTRAITAISIANPCVVTVNSHGLTTGQSVTISGVTGGSFTPSINGTFPVTVISSNTFSVPVSRNNNTAISLTNATASPITSLLRDRIRAVIHLIITSPDFTIQK